MRLLHWNDLRDRGIKHSRSQIWRKVREGSFPPPVQLGRLPAWPDNEIDLYINQLIEERDRRRETRQAAA